MFFAGAYPFLPPGKDAFSSNEDDSVAENEMASSPKEYGFIRHIRSNIRRHDFGFGVHRSATRRRAARLVAPWAAVRRCLGEREGAQEV
jgi:hypothetical protein